jgi:hypothetical protein
MRTPKPSSSPSTRGTQALIRRNQEDTQAFIREMQVETRLVLERIDQRADERQHEVIQAIQALRA